MHRFDRPSAVESRRQAALSRVAASGAGERAGGGAGAGLAVGAVADELRRGLLERDKRAAHKAQLGCDQAPVDRVDLARLGRVGEQTLPALGSEGIGLVGAGEILLHPRVVGGQAVGVQEAGANGAEGAEPGQLLILRSP